MANTKIREGRPEYTGRSGKNTKLKIRGTRVPEVSVPCCTGEEKIIRDMYHDGGGCVLTLYTFINLSWGS